MLSTKKYFHYTSLNRSGHPIHHVRSSKHYHEYNKEGESKLTQIFYLMISDWFPSSTASQPISSINTHHVFSNESCILWHFCAHHVVLPQNVFYISPALISIYFG